MFWKLYKHYSNRLNKFLNIPNIDFCKNLITILSKIFQEFIVLKINKIGEELSTMNENISKEYNNNIEKMKNQIKKLNEQLENKNITSSNLNSSNKNYLELESKLEKMDHEMKEKEKEFTNNINIEIQKYKKLEDYSNNQIKEKEKKISELESKIDMLNQEIIGTNQKNIKLQSQIAQKKENLNLNSNLITQPQENGLNLQNLFINIQNTFMDFKNSVDKLDKENENIFNLKNLENLTKETENKIGDNSLSLKNFFQKQIKELCQNYENEIKQLKDKYDEINFELTKKNIDINEQIKSKEGFKIQLKENETQINELKEISKSKDELLETQNNLLKVYEDKIKDYKKMKEDLEMNLAKNVYNFKMKEDEFDSLFMVIEGIVSKKKEKYEHNLNKLSAETKNMVENLVKQYKFFK